LINITIKNFKKLFNKIKEMNDYIEIETNRIEKQIISKTGNTIFSFLHAYINTTFTSMEYEYNFKNNNLLVSI
jgi:hypothetical protein